RRRPGQVDRVLVRHRRSRTRCRNRVVERDRPRHPPAPPRLRRHCRDGRADRAPVHRRLLEPHDGARLLRRRRGGRSACDPRDTLPEPADDCRAPNDAPGGGLAPSPRPRTETPVSAMMVAPRCAPEVGGRGGGGGERGGKLNFAESIAVIAGALLEAARDGRSVAETIELGKHVLARNDVMEGVPEMVNLVQVEATFRTGTQLVSVSYPIP